MEEKCKDGRSLEERSESCTVHWQSGSCTVHRRSESCIVHWQSGSCTVHRKSESYVIRRQNEIRENKGDDNRRKA